MRDPIAEPLPYSVVDREFHNIREMLEVLMSEFSPSDHKMRMRPNLGWQPPTDVYETDTEVIITMDIAGMDRNNISVFTDGNVVTIRGVRNEVAPKGKKQFHKMEIQVGPFQRQIPVPVPIDTSSIFSEYTNGLLDIRLKKKFDEPERRQIDVE